MNPEDYASSWNEPVTNGQILYDANDRRFQEPSDAQRQKNGDCPGLRDGWNGELAFNAGTVPAEDDEKVLKMDGSDGHKTTRTYLMSLNRTLNNG